MKNQGITLESLVPKMNDHYFVIKKQMLSQNQDLKNFFIKLADFESEENIEIFKKHFRGLSPQDFKDQ
jgi:hypothetical protein